MLKFVSKIIFRKAAIKTAVMSVAIIAIFVLWQSYQAMNTPLNISGDDVVYQFKRGSSASVVASELVNKNILQDKFAFKLWGRLSGKSKKLQAGEYLLQPGLTGFGLLNKMAKGEVKLYDFTIIEGWNFRQLMTALSKSDHLVHRIDAGASNEQIMALLGKKGEHPEGRFFPDTYHFPSGTTDIQFLSRAYDSMTTQLEKEWKNRAVGLPLKNAYEALILASIVEKESADPSERPLIAGVFINRLNKRMRLQTDPTVIYGIGDKYDGDIRFRHLREDTPYNTYTRHGLTPTPIAMPGLEAIRAACNPSETEYLYFVATGENGKHYFSSTNDEHQRAVTKYQRYRRKKK